MQKGQDGVVQFNILLGLAGCKLIIDASADVMVVERRPRKADVPTELQGFAVEGTALTVIIPDVDLVMIRILHYLYVYTDAHVI